MTTNVFLAAWIKHAEVTGVTLLITLICMLDLLILSEGRVLSAVVVWYGMVNVDLYSAIVTKV